MATKKSSSVKVTKVATKPVAKKPSKPVKPLPKKAVKTAPVKKAALKKSAKPTVKKVAAKSISKKPVAKATVKKVVKPVSKAAKPQAKPAPKTLVSNKKQSSPTVKKVTPIIPVTVKKNSVKADKSASKIMAKKETIKKTAVNTASEKAVSAKPAAEVKAKETKPVVIPKTSTKTVRKYQPEFTKSVLDKGQRDFGAPSQRYSDVELLEFKELIQRKLEAAKKELSYLHGLITRKDEMGGDEGDNRYMTMEDGSLSMEREQLSQMASRQITFIDHLEKAVMRIENKTYGICRVTGKLIDKARLRAVPHATLSIEAKMGSSK